MPIETLLREEKIVDWSFEPVEAGRCRFPDCSRPFNPRRINQVYCSAGCREDDNADLHTFGRAQARGLLCTVAYSHAPPNSRNRIWSGKARAMLYAETREYIAERAKRRAAAIRKLQREEPENG